MIKFAFPIPAWLGRVFSPRTMDLAETHGQAGRGWSFLKGFIDISLRVKAEPHKD